ncbi:MAG: hypothetical protein K8I30_10775, partial [Anaerolineae bacterium]|nr:hypothetical protein [Anaerolineae bacterium]
MRVPHMGEVCFFITPFGSEGSDTRRNSDRILDAIIRPAIGKLGYHLVRSDTLRTPDSIHPERLLQLAEAPLAIANLTGKNPTVFYQLAFRHTIEKPVVLMCAEGEALPFDPAHYRVIGFDLSDDDSIRRCSAALIDAIEANDDILTSDAHPLSKMIDIQQLRSTMVFTAEDVRKAFEKVPDLAHFRHYADDLRILIQR